MHLARGVGRGFGTIGFVLAAIVPCGVAQTPPDVSWSVVWDRRQPAILELSPQAPPARGPGALRIREFRQTAKGVILDPGGWHDIFKFGNLTGGPLTCAATRRTDGGWALVICESGGGTYVLDYFVTTVDLLKLSAPLEGPAQHLTGLRLADQPLDERPKFNDLNLPQIIERDRRIYLVGQSYLHHQPPDDVAIWIAPAESQPQAGVPGRFLVDGRVIAAGENPRVAQRHSDQYFVGMQQRPPDRDRAWGRWVQIYASKDLERWEALGDPPKTLEFYDYELCVSDSRLFVVGVIDYSRPELRGHRGAQEYKPPLALAVLEYNPGDKSWFVRSTRWDAALQIDTKLHVIPIRDGGLELIERSSAGEFTARKLLEHG